jgi:hypothetical protein
MGMHGKHVFGETPQNLMFIMANTLVLIVKGGYVDQCI